MAHKDDVKYKHEAVDIDDDVRHEWQLGDELEYAEGPCPVCAGSAWGPPIPEAEPGATDGTLSAPGGRNTYAEEGYVNWNCKCGFEHAKGEDGCGAYGVIQ